MSEELVKTKQDGERFVFAGGGYQDFPNTTGDMTAAVVSNTVDLSTVKYQNGEMVPLTTDDLQARLNESIKETSQTYEKAIDDLLDEKAREYGYENIKTAVTYADEPAVPQFQAEGQAFRRWRSLVYAKCYEIFDEVKQTLTIPTLDEVKAQLPAFELDQA